MFRARASTASAIIQTAVTSLSLITKVGFTYNAPIGHHGHIQYPDAGRIVCGCNFLLIRKAQ